MKLKSKKSKLNGVGFNDLVKEAVEVTRELRALDTLGNAKLTPDAFLASAVKIAQTTPQRLAELRATLEHPTSFSTFELAGTLRRFVVAFRSPNWPGPSRELRRYNFLLSPESLSEIVQLGSTTFEVAALAALLASETYPQDFGQCENLDAHYKRLNDLGLKRDALYLEIEKSHSADDLLIGPPDSSGRSVVSFAMTNGAVGLGPHSAERLVNWCVSQQDSP